MPDANKSSEKLIFMMGGLFLLFVTIFGSSYYFFFYMTGVQTVNANEFTCPADYTCSANGVLECTTSQPYTTVIARTNKDFSNPVTLTDSTAWVGLDNDNNGVLNSNEAFTNPARMTTSSCKSPSSAGSLIILDAGINLYFYRASNTRIQSYLYGCVNGKLYKFYSDSSISVDNIFRSADKDRTNVIKSSSTTTLYSCSRKISIDNIQKEILSWNQDDKTPSGGISSNVYTLSAGQKIKGEGTGTFKIQYILNEIPITTCTTSLGTKINIGEKVCTNQYTLETCEQIGTDIPKITTQTATPPQVCKNGAFTTAYNVKINLSKSIISTNEKFNIDFELAGTTDNKNIPITVKICKGSDCSYGTKTQLTGNAYLTQGKTAFSLDAPPVGYYTLKISFSHSDGDYSKEYDVQVEQELSLVVTVDNPIQFDNSPIVAYLKSFRSGSPKPLSSFEVDAVYNGIKQNTYTTEPTNLGVLKFIFSGLKGDGTLRIRARGSDENGLWTEWTDYFDVTVRKSTILFATDFPTDKCTGSYTLSFETKDSTNNFVETDNQIEIDKPSGGRDSVSVSGNSGKYSFTYNFANGGIYTVRITASNPQLGSSQLNEGQGRIVNILTGASCEGGGGGEDGGTDYTPIAIGIAFILVLIVSGYFILRKKK